VLSGGAPEESPSHDAWFVQQIQERVCVFAEAGSENNDLKLSAYAGHEVIHVRPLQHVHVDDLALDLHLHQVAGPQSASLDIKRTQGQQCCSKAYETAEPPCVLREWSSTPGNRDMHGKRKTPL